MWRSGDDPLPVSRFRKLLNPFNTFVMKRILVAIGILCSVLGVKAQKEIINDPNVQVRKVASFHGIIVSHAVDLYLSQSDEEAVAVSARDPEDRNHIRTVVEDGMLKISFDEESHWWKHAGNKRLRAYISFRTLDKLKASGASDIYVNGTLRIDQLEMELSGASDFKGAVAIQSLSIHLSGASDVVISGKAGTVTISASGASDVKGYDLVTDVCNAQASGASDIRLTVNKELRARVSGASDVHYKGEAVVREIRTSGAGGVSKRGR